MRRLAPVLLGALVVLLLALAALPPDASAQAGPGTSPAPGAAGQTGKGSSTGLGATVVPAGPTDPKAVQDPPSRSKPPVGHRMTARQAERLALADPKMRAVRRENPGHYHRIFLKGQTRWQLSVYLRPKGERLSEIGQVVIDDATGRITESWDGPYVAWTMARGIDGAFGRSVTNPFLWGVLLLLFLLPFVGRAPLRGPPAPLLLVAGFTAPLAFFNNARLDWAVPLSFGLLLALCAWGLTRALRRPRAEPRPLALLVPTSWLLLLGLGLLVFRVVLNVQDGNVIDVGYASVVGADKIGHGTSVYTPFPTDVGRGDTYGPLTYLAYLPFEQLFPWSGRWDDLPAAHAGAVALDALATLVLFLVGRSQESDRTAGTRRGVLYAYLWLACPFTAYCLNSNSNDALPAVMLGLLLLGAARPFARGMAAGAAGAAKIAPFAILPLLMTGRRVSPTVAVHHAPPAFWPLRGERPSLRGLSPAALVLAGAGALVLVVSVIALRGTDFGHLYDRTIGYQAGRPAPFMPWGFYDWLDPARDPVRVLAIAFAVVVAVLPRRHDVTGTAALSLAVIVALQLSTEYWFYLYVVWVLPLVIGAALADRPLRWPGVADAPPAVVPRMHGPVPEEDAPWAADARRAAEQAAGGTAG